jgi:hypothetical protein
MMHPVEPDARPHRPKLQVAAGLLDEPHGLFGQPSAALHRMARHQSGGPTGRPTAVPGPDGLAIQSESPGGAFEAMLLRIAQDRQPAVDGVVMPSANVQGSQVLRRDQLHGIPFGQGV